MGDIRHSTSDSRQTDDLTPGVVCRMSNVEPCRVSLMREKLLRMWDAPDAGGVYYSAAGAVTASERLNGMPCWDWTPYPSRGVEYPISTAIFPWMFGCEKVVTSTGTPWLKPMLHSVRDYQALRLPDIGEGIAGEIVAEIKKVLNIVG